MKHKPPLTKAERLISFIKAFGDAHSYGPSVREMMAGTQFPSGVVTYWLNCLRRDGVVTWDDSIARTVRVITTDVDDLVVRLTGDDAILFREAIPDGHDPEEVARDYLLQGAKTMRSRWGTAVNGAPVV